MAKLKPCPFCGKTPKIKSATLGGYYVICLNTSCEMMVTTKTMSTRWLAVEKWNRRDGERNG